jgi:hypothetical protein
MTQERTIFRSDDGDAVKATIRRCTLLGKFLLAMPPCIYYLFIIVTWSERSGSPWYLIESLSIFLLAPFIASIILYHKYPVLAALLGVFALLYTHYGYVYRFNNQYIFLIIFSAPVTSVLTGLKILRLRKLKFEWPK